MKKVLVIGSGGAGKSTFSRRLGALTGIKVFHLDKLYWQPNWTEPSKEEWRETVEKLLVKDEWILDGNFGGTADLRIEKCDTVILLDLPRMVCIYRVLKRRLKYRNTNRPDMTEGCDEKIDFEFLKWIWDYPKINKPRVEERMEKFASEKTIICLKSQTEVKSFFINLPKMK